MDPLSEAIGTPSPPIARQSNMKGRPSFSESVPYSKKQGPLFKKKTGFVFFQKSGSCFFKKVLPKQIENGCVKKYAACLLKNCRGGWMAGAGENQEEKPYNPNPRPDEIVAKTFNRFQNFLAANHWQMKRKIFKTRFHFFQKTCSYFFNKRVSVFLKK